MKGSLSTRIAALGAMLGMGGVASKAAPSIHLPNLKGLIRSKSGGRKYAHTPGTRQRRRRKHEAQVRGGG